MLELRDFDSAPLRPHSTAPSLVGTGGCARVATSPAGAASVALAAWEGNPMTLKKGTTARWLVVAGIVAVLFPTPGSAVVGLRKQCRRSCHSAVAACMASTGKRIRACTRVTLRRCRRQGLAACLASTTTTVSATTTTHPAGVLRYSQVSTGYYNSCATVSDGSVRCWGYGSAAFGIDSPIESLVPAIVRTGPGGLPLTGVKKISLGSYHVCAVMDDTTAKCWGKDTWAWGMLGNGGVEAIFPSTVVSAHGSTAPLAGVVDISAGGGHTCALLSDTSVKCWGYNSDARLGDGTNVDRLEPVTVVETSGGALTGVRNVSVGAYHTCAARRDTSAVCWGSNVYHQINSSNEPWYNHPVPIYTSGGTSGTLLTGIDSVSGGGVHNCALTTDSRDVCWGLDQASTLGRGYLGAPRFGLPAHVLTDAGTELTLVTSTDASAGCATLADKTLRCWGHNYSGAVGDGTNTDRCYAVAVVDGPLPSHPLADVVGSDTGADHRCALLGNGTIRCWGNNDFGAIGDGTTMSRNTPGTALTP